MRSIRPRLAAIAAVVVLVSGCAATGSGDASSAGGRDDGAEPASGATATQAPDDPDTPTSWGPTVGEVEEAQEIVSTWTPEQLAGQVIVGRFHGTDPQEPARMVRDLHLAGVSVTGDNVTDREQVLAMTSAIAQAAAEDGRDFPPVIGVDQEGGYVSHLRGIATEFPHFQSAGLAIQWFAPLGIFRFSYGFPLNEFKGDGIRYPDEVERFQFTIGSAF